MIRPELPLFCKPVVGHRYFTYATFLNSIEHLLNLFEKDIYDFAPIGKSVKNNSIYKLTLGTGATKIFMWSQMHGNESTTTRSLFYFINWFLNSDLIHDYKLYIIPVLNPDGLNQWTRENANGIDLNRDAQALSQPESKLLRAAFDSFEPDFCFNLHDQRTIYGTPDGTKAVQCSFLSPAANESREVTPARLAAMNVINSIVNDVSDYVNGAVGRYDDRFNVNCVGDTFQSFNVPTILFEAGQANMDYYRFSTVDVMFESLKSALVATKVTHQVKSDHVLRVYEAITTIETNFTDVLIKNVPSGNEVVNLSIMYQESVKDGTLYFVPILSGINDLSVKNAHRVIDFRDAGAVLDFEIFTGQEFVSKSLEIDIFY